MLQFLLFQNLKKKKEEKDKFVILIIDKTCVAYIVETNYKI